MPIRARCLGASKIRCAVRKDGSAGFGTAVKRVSGTVGDIPVIVHYAGASIGQVVRLMLCAGCLS